MIRNLLFQSAYQLAITLFLVYRGRDAFDIDLPFLDRNGFSTSFNDANPLDDYLNTFIFNTFVFCQVSAAVVRHISPPAASAGATDFSLPPMQLYCLLPLTSHARVACDAAVQRVQRAVYRERVERV
jgi:hypothetical protein